MLEPLPAGCRERVCVTLVRTSLPLRAALGYSEFPNKRR